MADCKRQNPDFVPTQVLVDGSYDCVCREGRAMLPTSSSNPRGGCVAADSATMMAAERCRQAGSDFVPSAVDDARELIRAAARGR